MSEPSNLRAPTIVRIIPPEQIERGRKLQASMEELDTLEAKKLADESRLADEQQRVEQERASIEETRRAASAAGRYMDAKYGWVGSTTRKDESR